MRVVSYVLMRLMNCNWLCAYGWAHEIIGCFSAAWNIIGWVSNKSVYIYNYLKVETTGIDLRKFSLESERLRLMQLLVIKPLFRVNETVFAEPEMSYIRQLKIGPNTMDWSKPMIHKCYANEKQAKRKLTTQRPAWAKIRECPIYRAQFCQPTRIDWTILERHNEDRSTLRNAGNIWYLLSTGRELYIIHITFTATVI